ncbi:MAG TPA: hypothetical protein PKJ69_05660 [Spirochaetota bacterium]|nr:hypothetical protein [Spirochaetota bacterium]
MLQKNKVCNGAMMQISLKKKFIIILLIAIVIGAIVTVYSYYSSKKKSIGKNYIPDNYRTYLEKEERNISQLETMSKQESLQFLQKIFGSLQYDNANEESDYVPEQVTPALHELKEKNYELYTLNNTIFLLKAKEGLPPIVWVPISDNQADIRECNSILETIAVLKERIDSGKETYEERMQYYVLKKSFFENKLELMDYYLNLLNEEKAHYKNDDNPEHGDESIVWQIEEIEKIKGLLKKEIENIHSQLH